MLVSRSLTALHSLQSGRLAMRVYKVLHTIYALPESCRLQVHDVHECMSCLVSDILKMVSKQSVTGNFMSACEHMSYIPLVVNSLSIMYGCKSFFKQLNLYAHCATMSEISLKMVTV